MQNLLTLAANPLSTNDSYVIVLGVGTVFVGLICIVILCKILSVCCKLLNKNETTNATPVSKVSAASPAPKAPVPAVIPNRRETVAAIAAAIAEDLGTDVSAIRIVSIEKL